MCFRWQVSSGHRVDPKKDKSKFEKRCWAQIYQVNIKLKRFSSHVCVFTWRQVLAVPGWVDQHVGVEGGIKPLVGAVEEPKHLWLEVWKSTTLQLLAVGTNKTIKHVKVRLCSQSSKSQLFKTPQNCQRWQSHWCASVRTWDQKQLQSLFLSLSHLHFLSLSHLHLLAISRSADTHRWQDRVRGV